MVNAEVPTVAKGERLHLESRFLRYSDPPRTTNLARLVFEVRAVNRRTVGPAGRCSLLELDHPAQTLPFERDDDLVLQARVIKASAPFHYAVFGWAQRMSLEGLILNGQPIATDTPANLWLAHLDEPSKLDRDTARRRERDAHRRANDRVEPPQGLPKSSALEVTLSAFLRSPTELLRRLEEEGDIVLRRRDAYDLRLSLDGRSRERDAGTALVARMLASVAADEAGKQLLARALDRTLPWMDVLPAPARHEFVVEFLRTAEASAEVGVHAPLLELIRAWRETAGIYADPDLRERMVRPLPGDAGPVSEPGGGEPLRAETG
jgi:hypothetical protein